MRILYVVQRYGPGVAGGAEALTAMLATRLAGRGHDVSVLTSCARDYDTWIDEFPPGRSTLDGVTVHRLPVTRPRDPARFSALSQRVVPSAGRAVTSALESAWMSEQGPVLDGFDDAFAALIADCDVAAAMTYLYATTTAACRDAMGSVPIVLHPTAHEEWPFRLPLIRAAVDSASGIACSTPEELELVDQQFRPAVPTEVIGIGFDPPPHAPDVDAFRGRFGLGDAPYVLCLGRIDPNKGTDEAIRFMAESRRLGSVATLVLCGAQMMDVEESDGLCLTGFVDDATRWAAIAGASVVLQPSRQESFGMTLAESWLMDRPVLVQRDCKVTAGLVRRSGGGVVYSTFSEFDAGLRVLLADDRLRGSLAAQGRRFVEDDYEWSAVLDRYEDLIGRSILAYRGRLARPDHHG